MNKIVEDLKQELRNAELINRIVKEERAKPNMEDVVGVNSKFELGEI